MNGRAPPGTATYGSSATRSTYTIWVEPAVVVDGTLVGVWLVGGGLLEATGTVGDAPVGGGGAVVVNSGAPVSGGLVDPAPGDVAVAALDAATVVVADGEAEVVEAAVVVAVVAAVVVVGSFDVACRPKSAV